MVTNQKKREGDPSPPYVPLFELPIFGCFTAFYNNDITKLLRDSFLAFSCRRPTLSLFPRHSRSLFHSVSLFKPLSVSISLSKWNLWPPGDHHHRGFTGGHVPENGAQEAPICQTTAPWRQTCGGGIQCNVHGHVVAFLHCTTVSGHIHCDFKVLTSSFRPLCHNGTLRS